MNDQDRTEKHEEARNTLPEELKPIFEELVEDYKFAVHIRYGKKFVSYIVLADLVKAGWRRSAGELIQK